MARSRADSERRGPVIEAAGAGLESSAAESIERRAHTLTRAVDRSEWPLRDVVKGAERLRGCSSCCLRKCQEKLLLSADDNQSVVLGSECIKSWVV